MITRTLDFDAPASVVTGKPLDVSGFYPSHYIQVNGTFVATYHIEASIDDGATWFDANELAAGSDFGALSSAKSAVIAAPARLLRINVTAYTSGTIVAKYMGLDTRAT